jgi:hypothetical protein
MGTIMKASIVDNNVVTNIILVDNLSDFPGAVIWENHHEIGKSVRESDNVPKYDKKLEANKAEFSIKVLLDDVAIKHGYDNINTACSYVGIPNKYQVESMSFVQWRADVWSKYYQIIESGNFSTVEDIMNQLPGFYMIQVF